MFVEGLIGKVLAAYRGHLLAFVVAEHTKKVEPDFAAYRGLHSMTSEISQLLQVDMLFRIKQFDELLDGRCAHLDYPNPGAFVVADGLSADL